MDYQTNTQDATVKILKKENKIHPPTHTDCILMKRTKAVKGSQLQIICRKSILLLSPHNYRRCSWLRMQSLHFSGFIISLFCKTEQIWCQCKKIVIIIIPSSEHKAPAWRARDTALRVPFFYFKEYATQNTFDLCFILRLLARRYPTKFI